MMTAICLIGWFILSMHKHVWSTYCMLPTSQAQSHIQYPPVTYRGKSSGVESLAQRVTWVILFTSEG